MNKPVIIYLSPFDILRPRTNQLSDVRFCEGFAQNGCEVHLIVASVDRTDNISKDKVDEVYGLEKQINIDYLPTGFTEDIKGLKDLFNIAWLGWPVINSIINKAGSANKIILLSRSGPLLLPYLLFRHKKNIRIIHWLHDLRLKLTDRLIYGMCDALLFTNSSTRNDLDKISAFSKIPKAVTLNPITEAQANELMTREDARKLLQLDQNKKYVVYTGKVGMNYDRELMYIYEAAGKLPEYEFILTGGKPETLAHWKKWCADRNILNVNFTGYLPDYNRIRLYQYAADVLLSYYTTQAHDPRYNFPNKICEYMLTGNVIVTPDYPATRDVLHKGNCIFCEPENADHFADAIRFAIDNPSVANELAAVAQAEVKEYTFRKQTQQVLAFFDTLS